MIKISNTSKMPCPSWSTQAIDTCPGARKKPVKGLTDQIALVDACIGCYARFGNYNRPNVKNARVHNGEDWKRENWVQDMVEFLEDHDRFRWFDSGDCYHLDLAWKILWVMVRTPWVEHWLPTRMYKFEKFQFVLHVMAGLPNVCVRFSSDSVQGETIDPFPGSNTSTIDHPDRIKVWDHVCMAYTRDGKCGDCRMCWDKDIPVITYPQHGRAMAQLELKLVA